MNRRLLVTGGNGFFGQAAIDLLREMGLRPLAASRRTAADVQLDVEDRPSLERALRAGDVIVDTVGPFQDRSTTLLETAIDIGCDLIDISDSLAYARKVDALRGQIDDAGIRVLTSCSSVSTLTAALVKSSGIERPVRVASFLVPSTRYSASPATALSLLRSVGQRVEVLRGGELTPAVGWRERRRLVMQQPIGSLSGHLFETADALWLPQMWPSLETVEFYVDTRVPGLNAILRAAAGQPWFRAWVERCHGPGHRLTRGLGRKASCLAMEIEGPDAQCVRSGWHAPDRGYRLAVAPAALAAGSILENRCSPRGLIAPHQHVDADELAACWTRLGVQHLSDR